MAGKQVVQVYCSAPQGKLGKAARVLVGFAKTGKLQPGESETVEITVGLEKFASFDDVGAVAANAYVLEAGSYKFFVGENVRTAAQISDTYEVKEDRVIEQLTAKCVPHNLTRRMKADGTYEETGMPKAERNRVLTEHMDEAFSKTDVEIDREILEYYADDILTELVDNGDGEVTEDDVQAYFESHADDVKA